MTMKADEQFPILLRARNPLFWVVSSEERRAERSIASRAMRHEYDAIFWDCATGARRMEIEEGRTVTEPVDIGKSFGNPASVFEAIRQREDRAKEQSDGEGGVVKVCREVWILRDLDHFLAQDFRHLRGLKSLARDLQDEMSWNRFAAVVVLTANAEIPPPLHGIATMLDWPLPDRAEIQRILEGVVSSAVLDPGEVADPEVLAPSAERSRIVNAAMGLRADDVSDAFSFSLIRDRRIDITTVASAKKAIIDQEPALTWFDPDPRGLDSLGGLEHLKRWLKQRESSLSVEARNFGVPEPRGILLVGTPGNGKSASAKAVPAAWGIPGIRLDLNATKSSLVGSSGKNIRRALKIVEAVAPAILWVDELEKAVGGAGRSLDSGVSADLLGTLLTWLQEHKGTVFGVFTANDVSALPPELYREGRIDEIFYVASPTRAARREILAATIIQCNTAMTERDPADFDLDAVAEISAGFSGAEVAGIVHRSLFAAFAAGRGMTTEDLLDAAASITPKTQANPALDEWVKRHATPASEPEEKREKKTTAHKEHARALDFRGAN